MKKILFLNLLLLLSAYSLHAQTDADELEMPIIDSVYNSPDEMPEPLFDLSDFVSKNLKYPKEAKVNGIGGTVLVKFVVNTDGSIIDVTIVGKRIPHGEDLENECIRLMKSSPKWKPGKVKDKPVKVAYVQRITFS
ncbi:MAG: energy transducer TonB [Flavipsychrobacter sp.]|jgi:TonB family protein